MTIKIKIDIEYIIRLTKMKSKIQVFEPSVS